MRLVKCETCGKEFETNIPNKRFCCQRCRKDARNRKNAEIRSKVCAHCGCVYNGTGPSRVCSACRSCINGRAGHISREKSSDEGRKKREDKISTKVSLRRKKATSETIKNKERKRIISWRKFYNTLTDEEKREFVSRLFKGKNKCITKPNINFSKRLNAIGRNTILEFGLGKYFFDIKYDDILVEINPTVYHNIDWIPTKRKVCKSYHKEKMSFAKDKGYECLMIFDWDDKEALIKKIHDGYSKIEFLESDGTREMNIINPFGNYDKAIEDFNSFIEKNKPNKIICKIDMGKCGRKLCEALGFALQERSSPIEHIQNLGKKIGNVRVYDAGIATYIWTK